ncbi:MAG: phosphoadenylyl-sulfate reductase [Leptonema sp. (in: bacteria)]
MELATKNDFFINKPKKTLNLKEIIELNKKFSEERFHLMNHSLKIMNFAYQNFEVSIASSFGLEDVVLIHLATMIYPKPKVFFLDTGRLHPETYQTVEKIQKKYSIDLQIYFPDSHEVEKLVREKGFFSFYESIDNRKECCFIRKVKPLQRALQNLDGWITGLRKNQGITRKNVMPFELDLDNGNILKINPLFNWGWECIKTFVKLYKIPYNPLHDKNYLSIGCEPCTRAVRPGEDIRAGRWWWESPEHKECGLHKR